MYSVSMDILVNIIAFFRVRTGQDFVSKQVWTRKQFAQPDPSLFAARAGAALALAADKME